MLNNPDSIPLSYFLWAIPLVQLVHELEEWNILKWYKKNYVSLPDISNLRFRIWILFFCLFQYVWITLCFFIPNAVLSSFLVTVLITLNMLNGLQHLYWQFKFMNYAPGVITFVTLILPLESYVLYRFIKQEFLPYWAVGIILSIIIPGMILTIIAGNKMTKFVKALVHELPGKLLKMFTD